MAMCVLLILLQLSCSYYAVGAQTNTPIFRKDYTYLPQTGSFYKIHTHPKDWWAAKKQCQLEGAEMFFPEDKAEADAVIAMWQEQQPQFEWSFVGISDLLSKGEYETTDGRSIDEIYHEWEENEPNDRDGIERCLIIRPHNAKYNDDRCSNEYTFICKKLQTTIDWNSLCGLADTSYQYNPRLKKCYKFHNLPMNWLDAYSVCVAEQSYLAVINSKEEAAHFSEMTAEADKEKSRGTPLFSEAVFLGFHRDEGAGFVTVQAETIEKSGYSVWSLGQPDNHKGNEACGSMMYDGTLNDLDCKYLSFFICENNIDNV